MKLAILCACVLACWALCASATLAPPYARIAAGLQLSVVSTANSSSDVWRVEVSSAGVAKAEAVANSTATTVACLAPGTVSLSQGDAHAKVECTAQPETVAMLPSVAQTVAQRETVLFTVVIDGVSATGADYDCVSSDGGILYVGKPRGYPGTCLVSCRETGFGKSALVVASFGGLQAFQAVSCK